MIKDTEDLDYMFVHTFGSEIIDSCSDFSFIALDFLKHVYPHIEEYSKFVYADDSMDKWAPDTGLRYKIFNTMLAAARHGDNYSREILCRIYKVYYKKEYNQLKRFKTISYDELLAFDNEEELFEETAARILTICPFMGIEVQPDCEYVIPDIKRILNDETFDFKLEPKEYHFDKGLFQEAGKEARELLTRQKEKDMDFYWRGDISKFKEQVFRYLYLPASFDFTCNRERVSLERTLSVTIAILRKRFRNREFSDDEILFFHEIYKQILAYSSQIGLLDEAVDIMLGRTDKFEFEIKRCRYHPETQKVATAAQEIQDREAEAPGLPAPVFQQDIAAAKEEEYLNQISDLKASLKQKQQDLNETRRLYLEAKEKARADRIDEEQWATDRIELHRLREYVYSLTEEDTKTSMASMEDMKAALKDRKIVIVGGHDNWVGYLKEIFPDWIYIKPSVSNTLPEIHAANADYLFFFTETLSHGSFNKYMSVVRKHSLHYSYLHGTNIEHTVASIYREVCASRN